jgi:hypothetical protein
MMNGLKAAAESINNHGRDIDKQQVKATLAGILTIFCPSNYFYSGTSHGCCKFCGEEEKREEHHC